MFLFFTRKKLHFRVISAAVAVLFLFSFCACLAKTKKEIIESKIHQIKSKRQQIEVKKQSLRKQLRGLNEKENFLSDQLAGTRRKLKKTNDDIEYVKSELVLNRLQLKQIKNKILDLDQNLSAEKTLLSGRLRDIYETREIDYLSILFGANDFADFINRADFLRIIVNNDLYLISRIQDVQRQKNEEKVNYQKKIQEKILLKSRLDSKEYELKSVETTRKNLLWDVIEQRKSVRGYIVELEHTTRELEAQLEELIRAQSRLSEQKNPSLRYSASGRFTWPTASRYITSSFGWRSHPIYGRLKFHTGIDIAASYGSSICAACDGVVIYSGYYGGYGYTVIINHGSGYSSLYAHCSSLYARYGQKVAQGQKIAAVGSTGTSTGPHLHFEIRQEGVPVNPRSKM